MRDSAIRKNETFNGLYAIKMSIFKKITSLRTSIGTTIKFHSHGDVLIPASWMNASKSCCDRRDNIVVDNRISVTISLEYLEAKHKIIANNEFVITSLRKKTNF